MGQDHPSWSRTNEAGASRQPVQLTVNKAVPTPTLSFRERYPTSARAIHSPARAERDQPNAPLQNTTGSVGKSELLSSAVGSNTSPKPHSPAAMVIPSANPSLSSRSRNARVADSAVVARRQVVVPFPGETKVKEE
ncbi:hypothetical protein E3U43_015531 [Larimichthys crocea]|uniref:Uncharacterized protein n=2 Tax=Larimichthys crocea TaxID=215358 RepID=A0ACD3RQT8_LARCR|nr:hypothetical protein E3U43_014867 [Larimichthys crocea]TMS21558.1 hypothetical protein E3U43_015531 [Larimichthys crocea]